MKRFLTVAMLVSVLAGTTSLAESRWRAADRDGPRESRPQRGEQGAAPQNRRAYDGGRNDHRDAVRDDDRDVRSDRGPRDVAPPYAAPRFDRHSRSYDRDDDRRHDDRGRAWRNDRNGYDRNRAEHFHVDRGRYYGPTRFSIGIYLAPPGYPTRGWYRGQRLPPAYFGSGRYWLNDYGRFELYDPPFGAGWVRSGDDALLIDIQSGDILDVVYSLFW